jgi:hypothetical protein
MTTPVIPYIDFGNLAVARNNNYSLQTLLQGFAWKILTNLQAIVVQDQSNLPNSAAKISNAFYPDPQTGQPDISLSYTPNTGAYPTGTIKFYFSGPNNAYDISCPFTVEFFDATHITITAVDAPAVTARFDASNPDQSALNVFTYAILGVAMPAWFDKMTNAYYNNGNSVA